MVTRIRPGWSDLDTNAQVTGGTINANIEGVALSSYKAQGGVINVPANTLTTILTANQSATFTNISIVSVSGEDYAKFFLVINGNTIDVRRTGPDRNLTFDYTSNPLALAAGDIVDVKVEHFDVTSLLDFDSTIYGYA